MICVKFYACTCTWLDVKLKWKKNIPLSHINVNAIMKGKYFIYVPVITST